MSAPQSDIIWMLYQRGYFVALGKQTDTMHLFHLSVLLCLKEIKLSEYNTFQRKQALTRCFRAWFLLLKNKISFFLMTWLLKRNNAYSVNKAIILSSDELLQPLKLPFVVS